jgi:hypothetical protein
VAAGVRAHDTALAAIGDETGDPILILSDVTLCHIVTLSWLYSHG